MGVIAEERTAFPQQSFLGTTKYWISPGASVGLLSWPIQRQFWEFHPYRTAQVWHFTPTLTYKELVVLSREKKGLVPKELRAKRLKKCPLKYLVVQNLNLKP